MPLLCLYMAGGPGGLPETPGLKRVASPSSDTCFFIHCSIRNYRAYQRKKQVKIQTYHDIFSRQKFHFRLIRRVARKIEYNPRAVHNHNSSISLYSHDLRKANQRDATIFPRGFARYFYLPRGQVFPYTATTYEHFFSCAARLRGKSNLL